MTSKSINKTPSQHKLPSLQQNSLSSLVEVKLDLSVVQTALTDVLNQMNQRVTNLEKQNS